MLMSMTIQSIEWHGENAQILGGASDKSTQCFTLEHVGSQRRAVGFQYTYSTGSACVAAYRGCNDRFAFIEVTRRILLQLDELER